MSSIGRMLIVTGLVIAAVGLLLTFSGNLPFRLGRLPGDITIRGKNTVFFFPLGTCILLNVLLWGVLWLYRRLS